MSVSSRPDDCHEHPCRIGSQVPQTLCQASSQQFRCELHCSGLHSREECFADWHSSGAPGLCGIAQFGSNFFSWTSMRHFWFGRCASWVSVLGEIHDVSASPVKATTRYRVSRARNLTTVFPCSWSLCLLCTMVSTRHLRSARFQASLSLAQREVTARVNFVFVTGLPQLRPFLAVQLRIERIYQSLNKMVLGPSGQV